MSDETYYQRNRDRLLEKAKEARKEYYERNKEAIRAKNLANYHAKRAAAGVEPGKRGRKPGTLFPGGYNKGGRGLGESGEFARADFVGALKSPPANDVIFEETEQQS